MKRAAHPGARKNRVYYQANVSGSKLKTGAGRVVSMPEKIRDVSNLYFLYFECVGWNNRNHYETANNHFPDGRRDLYRSLDYHRVIYVMNRAEKTMQNSDLSQPQFDDVLRKILEEIQPDYDVKIVEDPQRFLEPGEVSYSISGDYQIKLTYLSVPEIWREETVNGGDLETAIREKFDEMGIPKAEHVEEPNTLPGEDEWIEIEDRGELSDKQRHEPEISKSKYSIYAGKLYPEPFEKPEELEQIDDRAAAIYQAKIYCREYDRIEVVNNETGELVWRGVRTEID